MQLSRTYPTEQQRLRSTASVQYTNVGCNSCCYRLLHRRHYCRRMFALNHCSFRTSLVIIILCSLIVYYYSWRQTNLFDISRQPSKSVRILYLVRTSARFYEKRLTHLLETWIALVKSDTFFVTDTLLPNIAQDHMILTKETCGLDAHTMGSLCCKTAHDFQLYRRHISTYDWFCHFDDDQYVNVDNLQNYLSTLDFNTPYYIGRNSWPSTLKRTKHPYPTPFWFATLGAGVCLSKRTIQLLNPHVQNVSQYVDGCIRENYHDDIYLGFLLHAYLNIPLTKNEHFHSHIEKTFYSNQQLFLHTFRDDITFGFRADKRYPYFLPQIDKSILDPLRIRALHCLLYTHLNECQRKLQQHLFNSTE
ncbi:unnamed protein product [Adineta ricciae]|uniref:Fringe-like glycosyltransferase domain-containing protein n=1 Tax=Adineta ricciae TaxID=249248 RepID=A0A813RJZ7_ADIRI|nr:unnamed protein product [Adineta ricciae]